MFIQTMNPFRWALLLAFTALAATAADARKTVLFFGDSLTFGYGLEDPSLAFPSLIAKKIEAEKLPYRVVNAGLSGETSAGGLRRIDWVLRQPIAVCVIELGANDGLRGLSPSDTEKNLQAIIDKVRAKEPGTKIVLAGMQLPTSLGPEFRDRFAALYPELANKNHVALIPFLLEGVGGVTELNQPDQIHPTARGHERVAENVWTILRPLLTQP